MKRARARSVAGRVDDHGHPRHVETLAVGEGAQISDRCHAQTPGMSNVKHVAGQKPTMEGSEQAEGRGRDTAAARAGSVGGVNPHGRVGLRANALGATEVVGVVMREQHRIDIGEARANLAQQRGELVPMPGKAGVKDGQLPAVLDCIPVDVAIAKAMDAICHLHRATLPSSVPGIPLLTGAAAGHAMRVSWRSVSIGRDRDVRLGLRVLRLCSVFETPAAALSGRGVRFDPVGGMQNHTAQLTRALDALGVSQHVVTSRPPGAPWGQRVGRSAAVHRFGLPAPWARQFYSVPAAIAALRLARGVDVVHAHQGEDLALLPIGVAAAQVAGVPLVITLHTSLRYTFCGGGLRGRALSGIGARLEWAACMRADGVIALTPRLARHMTTDGLEANKLQVIPPGVNAAEFDDGADPFPDVPHPRIVFVGRLAYQKGVETLIEAVALMGRRDAHLLLVGDGPRRAAVEQAIDAHRLHDRVRIAGFRSHAEIPSILRHSDLFCLPSRFEELSSALLEAMYAGMPIVATQVGGLPDALGRAGRLVAPDDPASLARALDDLLSDPALAARLGAAARERARAYEWSELAKRVLDVYRGVVDDRARRAAQPAGEPAPPRPRTRERRSRP